MSGGKSSKSSAHDDGDWPVELAGVTESVVTTLGPNDRWNAAALGLRAPDEGGDPVTARTWGNTRTRRNFRRRGGGYVQFVDDPVAFVDAALSIHEVDSPVLEGAAAWAEVEVERVDAGEDGGTRWEEWTLSPVASAVEREAVPTINRGFNAAIEATVAASRLGVDAYDAETMERRLTYFESVGRKCGDDRVRAAFARLRDHVGRDSR